MQSEDKAIYLLVDKTFCLAIYSCTLLLLCLTLPTVSQADSSNRKKSTTSAGIDRARSSLGLFSKKLNIKGGIFDVQKLPNIEHPDDESFVATTPTKPLEKPMTAEEKLEAQLRFVSQDPSVNKILPPTETPSVRVSPDAPSSIKGLVAASRQGNMELAGSYADQFVRMQKNFFFEVKQMTKLIGEALIRQDVINGDDWLGAEQMLDIEMAKTRNEQGVMMKPDHKTALEQITPDTQGKAHIFYFFNMSCSWCRKMAPDIERLWQIAKNDPNVSMNALTIGAVPQAWLDEYKDYTGLSIPVYDGTDLAKEFNLGFVPAVIVIAPTENKAYLKTGQQSFLRMYQFVRAVQGLPATQTKQINQLLALSIGQKELEQKSANPGTAQYQRAAIKAPARKKVEVERF